MENGTGLAQNSVHQQPRIGWLADLEFLGSKPDRLRIYQDRLRVDTIWLESSRYHTAGYKLSEKAWQTSPFKEWQKQPGLIRHRQVHRLPETAFPVLPGILFGADDSNLLNITAHAQGSGIRLWGHMGLWSYGGMIYPELAVRGLLGQEISKEEDDWGSCFCPSKPVVNQWLAACLHDCITRYPLQGIELDHARFVPPASLPNLLTCTCKDCAQQASALGIDLLGLVEHLQSAIIHSQSTPASLIIQVLKNAATLLEALDALMFEQAASRWFSLRATLLSAALNNITSDLHKFVGYPFELGIDIFPPSIALLGGHSYSGLVGLDYLTGGFGTIGWERVGITTCLEWARFLIQTWPDCDESVVLSHLFRLFGFTEIELPLTLDGITKLHPISLAALEASEIRMIAKTRPKGMAIYAPANVATLGTEGLSIVCKAIIENELDGIILAGLESLSNEQEKRVLSALKILY